MKNQKNRNKAKFKLIPLLLWIALFTLPSLSAHARPNVIESTQKASESQIKNLVEPLLDKYCHDQCKLLGVRVTVDLATNDAVAPGFDEMESRKINELAPSSAHIKLLIDDKVGPVSRSKLLDLIQQYLDTLDYPIKIDTQISHFPLPQGSEGKIGELREKITKQFLTSIHELLTQFCPQQCLLADYALRTDVVNGEEAQYGNPGEFLQDGDTAIKIKEISATLLMDQSLSPEEQANIFEMAKLKTNSLKNVTLTAKSMKFPHPVSMDGSSGIAGNYLGSLGAGRLPASIQQQQKSQIDSSSNSNSNTKSESNNQSNTSSTQKLESKTGSSESKTETDSKVEKYTRIEKIERLENGDAVHAELQKFKLFGLIFACSIIALLIFIAIASMQHRRDSGTSTVHRVIQSLASDPASSSISATTQVSPTTEKEDRMGALSKRYEIERLLEELIDIYAQQPRVAKQVFSRVLTEEGTEFTASCIHIFGESIVIDVLRDPSLQTDLAELMEFYAKNTIDLTDDEKLDLLRKLHSRTIVGKLQVLGNRSSNLFDFLAEMDGLQILELIRTESLTVKSIVLTQCDSQKRSVVYAQMDADIRLQLLAELSRIDYLPRDYIFNVASALKRKRRENPRLNTEALPGSEVLVSLLERTGQSMQKTVLMNLEISNPDSARTVKSKLVSIETLKYLRDGQLLEVVLSLKHDELIQFLKGAPTDIRKAIFSKSPKELVVELEEELDQVSSLSRETYQAVERKILNRIKIMANEGHLNLIETNERMFADNAAETAFVQAVPAENSAPKNIKKVSGW